MWLDRSGDEFGVGFQKVEGLGTGKNRVHIDIAVDDLADARDHVVALGGSEAPGYEEGGFLVMADPEGNVFCLIPLEPFELDEQGRTNYRHSMEL